MRKLMTIMLAGGLVAGLFAPMASASKPKVVWKDATGDADAGNGVGASAPVGVDLESGSIARKGKNLEFTVKHADMPPSGSLPEAARFMWAFAVGNTSYRLTVKSADIGKPDLLAGQTDERVGTASVGHFRLEGDCGTGETIGVLSPVNCAPLAYLEGTWDAANMSFTFPVPMKLVKAKPKSVIQGGGGDAVGICQICWVSHIAERSLDSTIIDDAAMLGKWKVPKK